MGLAAFNRMRRQQADKKAEEAEKKAKEKKKAHKTGDK